MKLGVKLFLAVFMTVMIFTACTPGEADCDDIEFGRDDYDPDYVVAYFENEEGDEGERTPSPGLWDYTFIWPEGRDREWEEDIIYFAQTFLFVHPLMRNVQIPVTDVQTILHGAPLHAYTDNFHDAALRTQFLGKIHELIAILPELEDYEIIFSLAEIAALLGDAHTGFRLDRSTFQAFAPHYYPFAFMHVRDGFFVNRVFAVSNRLAYYEHALDSRLVAINGVEVSEIMRLLSRVIAHENAYYIPVEVSLFDLMYYSELLIYLGISTGGESEFMFESAEGYLFRITTSAVSSYGEMDFETISSAIDREALLKYSRPDWQWYEFLDEYNTLYVRLRNFFGPAGFPLSAEFYLSLAEKTRTILDAGEIDKLVVDLRGNRGGFLEHFEVLFDLIYAERNCINAVYILVDNYTYSSGVIAAAILREYIEGALLLGEPTGQPSNFFAAPSMHRLPHSNISFSVSRMFFRILPECSQNALYPDILIPLTFADLKNGHDPALEAVLSGIEG